MSFLKLLFVRQHLSALLSGFILNPPRGSRLRSLRSRPLPKSEMQVDCLRSIHEVSETLWDSILPADNQFHRHRFIRVVEDANVEESTFWYLLFKDKTGLAGTAVLCSFRVSLDLFIGDRVSRLAKFVRRRFPNFLRPRILFCGLPVSLGQSNLFLRNFSCTQSVAASLAETMQQIARAERISYLCVKELLETHNDL